ncbi:MAG TPA: pantoate--beta-alanine ligase [Gemmatimonadaceae bacterium]|nr:pantoate--beta-alanine ligase [Gemmatimonadaceae bacterium]
MQRVTRVTEVRDFVSAARARGARIGFVPTMGFLHEGHLRLVDEARRRADLVVMSIFVNPLQFGPTEDLSRYPRDEAGDAAKADARGVDLLFIPAGSEIYPEPPRVVVTPRALAARWEGAARPGHFEGVLTVVAKLFNIVQPHVAVFGQKDIQQATLVRAMVRDLDMPVEIVVSPTVREADGLAMSSRNSYLDAAARERALALSGALRAVQDAHRSGERSAARLEEIARAHLAERGIDAVDYVAVADANTLEPLTHAEAGSIVALAARVGRTRLIDNVILGAS